MSAPGDLQARLALLAQGFRTRLPARFEQMDAAYALCRGDMSDSAHWQELYRLLHSLGGAAGTFGAPEMGLAARRIEEKIKTLLAQNDCSIENLNDIGADLAALAHMTPPAPAA
ncbi:Hpt domain-containing protein [Massilia atriviolacea]|uniref:Hpt domain-containing protein n=1 Tax=Massilia atriviolacea TaxID=2495579 RepID=A0A430HKW9_9BURK|nr:Hpt domain-containing protein [Massilia atriviolacea]RSZ58153.1 Hpt domain-containing protein [Massilia atriviolacea]